MKTQPITLLICALGGEGGGVLTEWLVDIARHAGYAAQATSIPGVAQRTGATTYYIEVLPNAANAAARPVLALNPSPGEVDLMVASELLESIRAIQAGYVSPDRTVLLASTSRVFTVDEKSAMGDGRVEPERMYEIATYFARRAVLADFSKTAVEAKCPVSAVLLGAIAATGVLPIKLEAFRAAIQAEGKAVDSNLRGFEAGLALVAEPDAQPVNEPEPKLAVISPGTELEAAAKTLVPHEAKEIAIEGVRRLLDYQGPRYVQLYLDRIARFAKKPNADGVLIRELARHLAVRMSFEDTIRVAQLKLRDGRIERLRGEAKARDGDLIEVTEFLKPGPEEIFSILPPALGRPLLAFIARRGWSEKSWPMRVRTTGVGGYLRLKFLASLRSWRPRSLRYAEEQAWIERWLALVERTLAVDAIFAREVAETARLVKGYGETYKRGHGNWTRIVDEVIEPLLAARAPKSLLTDAVVQCRVAALADPEGQTLGRVIDSVRAASVERRIAAE
ncbi:MAG TPA: indolepyruvate oxidoreductase subunit beta family protein [Xanthobacteraceae bacterium]